MKDSPSFKTLISSLLSGNLDKFNTLVEIGSAACDVGPGRFFVCICCQLLRFHFEIAYRHTLVSYLCRLILVLSHMLPLIYQNGRSNDLHFFSRLLLIDLYILLKVTAVVR